MTMDFAIELIGRYFLTGIIACGAAIILMTIRMTYMTCHCGLDFCTTFNDLTDEELKVIKKKSFLEAAWRGFLFLLKWPYSLIMGAKDYFSMEEEVLKRLGFE